MTTEIFDDLVAEQDRLEAILDELDEEAWLSPSAAAGWSVADVVLHLAQTEEAVVASAAAAAAGGRLAVVDRRGDRRPRRADGRRRSGPTPAEVFDRWRVARRSAVADAAGGGSRATVVLGGGPAEAADAGDDPARRALGPRARHHRSPRHRVPRHRSPAPHRLARPRHVAVRLHGRRRATGTRCSASSSPPVARPGDSARPTPTPRSPVRPARSAASAPTASHRRSPGSSPPARTARRRYGSCATTPRDTVMP